MADTRSGYIAIERDNMFEIGLGDYQDETRTVLFVEPRRRKIDRVVFWTPESTWCLHKYGHLRGDVMARRRQGFIDEVERATRSVLVGTDTVFIHAHHDAAVRAVADRLKSAIPRLVVKTPLIE